MPGLEHSSYAVSFTRGRFALAGFAGWGRAVHILLVKGTPVPDWELLAAWGMGAVLALGGVLMLASAGIAFGFAVLIVYAPYVEIRNLNLYDDYLAYLPFVRPVHDTGTRIEPFSLGRIVTCGGQSLRTLRLRGEML